MKYRILATPQYLDPTQYAYRVQVKRTWFWTWENLNYFLSMDEAEQFVEKHKAIEKAKVKPRVVKVYE